MKKSLRNLSVVLIMAVAMGSMFMFCTPKTACNHVKNVCKSDSSLLQGIMDQVLSKCETMVKDANQDTLNCIGTLDKCSLAELLKCEIDG